MNQQPKFSPAQQKIMDELVRLGASPAGRKLRVKLLNVPRKYQADSARMLDAADARLGERAAR
jgi:hypothetical protein